MAVLTPELRAWLRPGHAGMLATADASRQPAAVRFWGVRARPEIDVVEVLVQRSAASRVLKNLTPACRAAVNVIEVTSYRSRTFKGVCSICPVEPDPAFVTESLRAMNREFGHVGMPPNTVQRMLAHGGGDAPDAMIALLLEVDAVFDQSPGPGAGARL